MMKHTNILEGRTSEQFSKHRFGKTRSLDKNSYFFSIMSILYCFFIICLRKEQTLEEESRVLHVTPSSAITSRGIRQMVSPLQ